MTRFLRAGAGCAALILWIALCFAGAPHLRADVRSPDRFEIWDREFLQGLLVRQEEQLASFKERLRMAERSKEGIQGLVQLCEKAHKVALDQLAAWKDDPDRDEGVLKDAEDYAELTDLELGTRRKELLAASSSVDAVTARKAELESYLAVVRSKLKVLENLGEADWDDFLDAKERHARSFLRAALRDQTEAECELDAAEAKVAAVRKKVAISKARVLKAKDALEKVNQDGKGPRLGAARSARSATAAALSF